MFPKIKNESFQGRKIQIITTEAVTILCYPQNMRDNTVDNEDKILISE